MQCKITAFKTVPGGKPKLMEAHENNEEPVTAIAFEHLTGPSRGTVSWLATPQLDVAISPTGLIHISETRASENPKGLVARLHRTPEGYAVKSVEGQDVWVNGKRVTSQQLLNLDMIEFGETGPLSRYCQYGEHWPLRRSLSDIFSDALAYLRVSRQPKATRTTRAFSATARRLARETTVLFRAGVIIALVVLTVLIYQQYRLNALLQQEIERSADELESFAKALARSREDALTPDDLEALRREFAQGLSSNVYRLEELERLSQASTRVIAQSSPSVVFLQGAYGFKDKESGLMLRHIMGPHDRPLIAPTGQPLLTTDGDGPVAERQFVGTGFAVENHGILITNRHLAVPWENDTTAGLYTEQGYEAVMIKLIGFPPGEPDASPLELLLASDEADLAILHWGDEVRAEAGLRLADTSPAAGDSVIVMGYPTGLRSMLVQAGPAFVEKLQEMNDTNFWSVAKRLSEGGHIAPLSSRGIVGQITEATIVYDADTTLGGSGGPVLNADGEVVAVNAAILPEYGGSNLGVPVVFLRRLLEDARLR